MTVTLIIMVAAAAGAGALALWHKTQRRGAPTIGRDEPPTSLDRRDFRAPHAPWLIAVFTSASCSSCEAVWHELRAQENESVAVANIEIGAEPELHRKYRIESVPTAVIADSVGHAKLAFVGPLGPDHRRALTTTLGLDA